MAASTRIHAVVMTLSAPTLVSYHWSQMGPEVKVLCGYNKISNALLWLCSVCVQVRSRMCSSASVAYNFIHAGYNMYVYCTYI